MSTGSSTSAASEMSTSPAIAAAPLPRRDRRRDFDDLRTISVSDVMHPGIVSCSHAATGADIARIMASSRVHCVAVIGISQDGQEKPRVWGIVSDLDVLEAATRPGAPATAASLAKQPVITVRPTMSVLEATEAMVKYGAHHVVVVDPDQHTPVGILSTLDIADALSGSPR
jgi:CBS domain-containing protein